MSEIRVDAIVDQVGTSYPTFTYGLNISASQDLLIGGESILSDTAGSLTLQGIDALDATTEATIEAAIDTLSGLTSVGTITTGVWNATPIDIPYGGTNASTASAARTNLGLAIGSDVQAWDADLDAIAALAVTDGNFIVGNGTAWIVESGNTARTSPWIRYRRQPYFCRHNLK